MSARAIRNERDRTDVLRLIGQRKPPFTVSITKGAPRSIEQNKLQRRWCNEAAEQLADDDAEGYRAFCKLRFGVPILRAESDRFREVYDRLIRPRDYPEKLELMAVPMDLPVTRLMTTAQKKRYLDAMWQHFTALGVRLTDPDDKGLTA